MNVYKKIGVVAGQVYVGLGFAILGVVAEVIVVHIISIARDRYMDIFGTIMDSWIGFLFGLLVGICLFGYRFLKTEGRQNEFLKFLLIAAFGTCGGFLGLYLILSSSFAFRLPSPLAYFIVVTLPFTGVALGSILVLTRDNSKRTSY